MEKSEWENKGFSIFIVDIYSSVPLREHSNKNIALGVRKICSAFHLKEFSPYSICIFRHVPPDSQLLPFRFWSKCKNYLLRVKNRNFHLFYWKCIYCDMFIECVLMLVSENSKYISSLEAFKKVILSESYALKIPFRLKIESYSIVSVAHIQWRERIICA
jgi:hypothetical protein